MSKPLPLKCIWKGSNSYQEQTVNQISKQKSNHKNQPSQTKNTSILFSSLVTIWWKNLLSKNKRKSMNSTKRLWLHLNTFKLTLEKRLKWLNLTNTRTWERVKLLKLVWDITKEEFLLWLRDKSWSPRMLRTLQSRCLKKNNTCDKDIDLHIRCSINHSH